MTSATGEVYRTPRQEVTDMEQRQNDEELGKNRRKIRKTPLRVLLRPLRILRKVTSLTPGLRYHK